MTAATLNTGSRTGSRNGAPLWPRIAEGVIKHAVLIVLSVIFLIPLFWMVSGSFKTVTDLNATPTVWFPKTITFENYIYGLKVFPFLRYFFNTAVVCVLSMIGAAFSSAMVAYGLARIEWRGRRPLFAIIIGTLMIPFYVTMLPLFEIFRAFGWVNTWAPLIVPHFFGVPFFIFLLRQFFMTIPKELSESARLDGASEWTIFWRVILPLAKPALAAVALFQFLGGYVKNID